MAQEINTDLVNYLDPNNRSYFLSLAAKKLNRCTTPVLKISDGTPQPADSSLIYPTPIAPKDLLQHLPVIAYSKLMTQKDLLEVAHIAKVWIKKMQAGSGSSILRKSYLARLKNIPEAKIKIGAKGTDLYAALHGKQTSLAELQILQMISSVQNGVFAKVIFHDIISSETDEAIQELWNSPTHFSSNLNYKSWILSQAKFNYFGKTYQAFLPTLNEKGEWTKNRVAPGGHAFFGVDALLAALSNEQIPDRNPQSLIGVIANGEDLCATPDAYMVGWMLKNSVPIAMVTTDKTPNDMKGGMISLVPNKKSGQIPSITLLELAQAKASDQEQLFYDLGLRAGDQKAYFNTNMVLINYQVLTPLLLELTKQIGVSRLLEIISPDLIENWKSQTDSDGENRKYLQLEGAMGSSFLNLDKYWRENYGKPLIHFINVEQLHRTEFFSPIKTPIDFVMQFYSDRYSLDSESFRLKDNRRGMIPKIELSDPLTQNQYYNDMESVIKSFNGTGLLKLDSLKVEGKVDFSNLILEGSVEVINQTSDILRLKEYLRGQKNLKNTKILYTEKKQFSLENFS